MFAKFRNAGQTCIAPNRFFVHASVLDAFTDRLLAAIGRLKQGEGCSPGMDLGPLICDAAARKVEAHVANALARGALLRAGGSRLQRAGHFFEPTLLVGVTPHLAARVGEHSSKVHRYLASLVSSGFVYQDAGTGRYVLGAEAILLRLAAQRQSDALALGAAEAAKLVEMLDVSCFVAVMSNQGPVIVRWEEPLRAIVLNARVGSILPVLWSATGLTFAAFDKSDLIDALIMRELAAATSEQRRQLPNRKAVDAMLTSYREHGCTWVRDQMLKGVSAISAPIFDDAGRVAAALVALGVSDSFDVGPEGPNAAALRQAAESVSRRLGYVVEQHPAFAQAVGRK